MLREDPIVSQVKRNLCILQCLDHGKQGGIERINLSFPLFAAVIEQPGGLLRMQQENVEMNAAEGEQHTDPADEIIEAAVFFPPGLLNEKRRRIVTLADTCKAVRLKVLA